MESESLKEWYKHTTQRINKVNNLTTYALNDFLKVCKYPIVRFQAIGFIQTDRLAELQRLFEAHPPAADIFVQAAMVTWCDKNANNEYMIATCDNHIRPAVHTPEPFTIYDEEASYLAMWALIFEDESVATQFKLTFSHSEVLSNYQFYFERPNMGLV